MRTQKNQATSRQAVASGKHPASSESRNDTELTRNERTKTATRQMQDFEKLVARLENSGVEQFVRLSQNPVKIFGFNFLSGVARGLGFTVGTALVLTVAYKVLSRLISMNIPYLTEMLVELVEFVKRVQ
jgi:hypothetical protein